MYELVGTAIRGGGEKPFSYNADPSNLFINLSEGFLSTTNNTNTTTTTTITTTITTTTTTIDTSV
jgi:hypothetical protein